MTSEEQTNPEPAQLPLAPSQVRLAAMSELGRLTTFVANLSMEDWKRPSAVTDWSIGDVVTHLNLALGLYRRVLDAALAGRGSGSMWKTFGQISKAVMPAASPAFNAINSALPRMIDRALAPEVTKGQFAAGSRSFEEKLSRVTSEDYTRPVYYLGQAWPLSFFLAAILNELAIHGWDMASVLDPRAYLSEDARSVLPGFYWAGTSFMLHMPKGMTGTIQVSVDGPRTQMWWTIEDSETTQGVGEAPHADATISGESGAFILALAGRIAPDDALRSPALQATGTYSLAQAFLGGWKII